MSLKSNLVAILAAGKKEGKSDEWMALTLLHWMDTEVAVSLSGNGWLDDDPATEATLSDDWKQFATFNRTATATSAQG
jgi:hypothetical protein